MSYKILLHDEASEELADAYHWYEDRSEGLGERFMALLNKDCIKLRMILNDTQRKGCHFEKLPWILFPM